MLQQMKIFFLYLRNITLEMLSDRVSVVLNAVLALCSWLLTSFVRSLKRALSEKIITF